MNIEILQQIAMAERRGEPELIEFLGEIETVKSTEATPIKVDQLNENLRQGYEHYVRRLRSAC